MCNHLRCRIHTFHGKVRVVQACEISSMLLITRTKAWPTAHRRRLQSRRRSSRHRGPAQASRLRPLPGSIRRSARRLRWDNNRTARHSIPLGSRALHIAGQTRCRHSHTCQRQCSCHGRSSRRCRAVDSIGRDRRAARRCRARLARSQQRTRRSWCRRSQQSNRTATYPRCRRRRRSTPASNKRPDAVKTQANRWLVNVPLATASVRTSFKLLAPSSKCAVLQAIYATPTPYPCQARKQFNTSCAPGAG